MRATAQARRASSGSDPRHQVEETVRFMEGALPGGVAVGNAFSLDDISVFAIAVGLPSGHGDIMNERASPRAPDWLDRMKARPGVAAAPAMPNHGPPAWSGGAQISDTGE